MAVKGLNTNALLRAFDLFLLSRGGGGGGGGGGREGLCGVEFQRFVRHSVITLLS